MTARKDGASKDGLSTLPSRPATAAGEGLTKSDGRLACWRWNRRPRLLKAITASALQTEHGGGDSAGQRRSGRVPSPLFRLGSACRGRRLSDVLAAETAAATPQDGGDDGGGFARRR